MTSQVYYRKWRPLSFGDLAGQEHVATTLRRSIEQGGWPTRTCFAGRGERARPPRREYWPRR